MRLELRLQMEVELGLRFELTAAEVKVEVAADSVLTPTLHKCGGWRGAVEVAVELRCS